MARTGTGRLRHFQEVVVIPTWRLGVYLVAELVGTALTWRDLLIPPRYQSKWHLDVLPHWEWGWWAVGTAFILLVTLFEHSFRVRRKVEEERDAAIQRASNLNMRHVEALERQAEAAETANYQARRTSSGIDAIVKAKREREEMAARGLFPEPFSHWISLAMLPFAIPKQQQFEGFDSVWPLLFYDAHLCDGNVDTSPRDPTMLFDPASPRFQDLSGNDLTVCRVVWDEGRFEWAWVKKHLPSHRMSTTLYPWELGALQRRYLSPETAQHLEGKAKFVWAILQGPIQPLLNTGKIKLWARKASATAPYSEVTADMWPHYEVTDWGAGRADAPNGEMLFSIRAEIIREAGVIPGAA